MTSDTIHRLILKGWNPFKWKLYVGTEYVITVKKIITIVPAVLIFMVVIISESISKHGNDVLHWIQWWCHDEHRN